MYVAYVCMYVCMHWGVAYARVYTRGQCILLTHSLPYFLERGGLSLNLEPGWQPASSRHPAVCPSPLLALGLKGCFTLSRGAGNPLSHHLSYLSLQKYILREKKTTWNLCMQSQKLESDYFRLFLPQIWLPESLRPGLSLTILAAKVLNI